MSDNEQQREHQIESVKGTIDVQVSIDGKALILLGVVVYFAAKAGTKKAIKKAAGGDGFLTQLKGAIGNGAADGLKKAGLWAQSTDSVDQAGVGAGGSGLPDVTFEVPKQPGPENQS